MSQTLFKLKFAALILWQLVLSRFGVAPTYGLYVRTLDPQKVSVQNTEDLSQVVAVLYMLAVVLGLVLGALMMAAALWAGK